MIRKLFVGLLLLAISASCALAFIIGGAQSRYPRTPSLSAASTCPQGTGTSGDGCAYATSGTPQLPNLLDAQKVVMLNIIPGSGYTNGTYTWTTTGGGGSGATGTVTVSGGLVGGAYSQSYTISNEGSGYTSRPTIVVSGLSGGSGYSITPSVYQATPHNASTPWNMPGVDYYVGIPAGTTLADPTTTLPSGATYASNVVTVTGCNVTLNALDFTLHNTSVNVNVSSSNCTTTIQNSKFQANGNTLQPIALLTNLGSGGNFIFQYNTYNGLATLGGTGTAWQVNDPIEGRGNGNSISLLYNYFYNFDSKVIQISGSSPSVALIEKYNLFADFGSCNGCSHGEAEYTYSGNTASVSIEFNTYIIHFYDTGNADLTSLQAVAADTMTINGTTDDHNVLFLPGPQTTCSQSNSNAYTASRDVFDLQGSPGTLENVAFSYNYLDASGAYANWYHGANSGGVTYTNNVDAGAGGSCN
jgi:hypothetical protein